jgi:ribosome-associated protein
MFQSASVAGRQDTEGVTPLLRTIYPLKGEDSNRREFLMKVAQIEKIVVTALEDVKGKNVEAIDTRKLTPLFERIVIASGDSSRHVRSLARNVEDKAREAGVTVLSTEGGETGEWVLVDLGDVVVHIMQPAIRSHYALEELWGNKGPQRAHKAAAADA